MRDTTRSHNFISHQFELRKMTFLIRQMPDPNTNIDFGVLRTKNTFYVIQQYYYKDTD